MTRAYLRLDPAFDEHKAAYPDGPYAALVACLCLAEMQHQRGRFRNEAYLRALMGRRGRHLKYLLDHGDLVVLADGRLYVDGWDEWQEGDWKVGERMARLRHRLHRNPNRNEDRNPERHSPSDGGRLGGGVIDGAGAGAGKALASDRHVGPGFKEKLAAAGGKKP
jgi:hypothetical protein